GAKKTASITSDQLTSDGKDANGKKVVKTRDVAPSIRCGCLSAFNAILKSVELKNGRVAKVYTIVYAWQHNHDLGDRTELGTQQKSAAICDRIKAMYLDGKSISVIMDKLTIDYSRYTSLMRNPEGTRLTRDNFITYDDVYNIVYAINAKLMRKATDEFESARLWLDHLKADGYFVYHDTENHRYHGFSSKWQLEELVRWGDVFCFDGTHHACGKTTFLYTIVVKNRETGLGVPVAFFLTKISRWNVLVGWLEALKAMVDERFKINYQPNVVITDQGDTEINAIRHVFPLNTKLFYCAWHVLQAWQRQLTVKKLNMEGLSVNERQKRREERRIDTVIYILVHRAVPHYQNTWVRADAKVGRMTPGQKQVLDQQIRAINHRDQERMNDPDVVLLKEAELDETVLHVRSFTDTLVFYDIDVNWSARSGLGVFKSCSCLDFETNKSCCKHLALAIVEFPGAKFVYGGHQWEAGGTEMDMVGDQESPELDAPQSVEFTALDEARYLADSIANTLDSADRAHGLLNSTEVLFLLQKARDLVAANTKLAPEEELDRKRQRQRKSYNKRKE
ncbi:hypothetical protein BGZ83_003078, partial [Gryganskiella cystojenkinii]